MCIVNIFLSIVWAHVLSACGSICSLTAQVHSMAWQKSGFHAILPEPQSTIGSTT